MKKMSGFWKYFLIALLLVFGLLAIGILYLFFVPNSSLFGISYIGKPVAVTTESYAYKNDDTVMIDSVKLKSGNFDVYIQKSNSDTISAKLHSSVFGFVLTKNREANITVKSSNKMLTFEATEPHGFALQNKSYIELKLPKDANLNLEIENNSANVKIEDEVHLSNLTYKANKGSLTVKKGEISGTINLDANKSNVAFAEGTTNNNEINIALTTGSVLAENSTVGNVKVTANRRGTISIDACKEFKMNTPDAGGRVELNTADKLDIISSDTKIIVKTKLNNGGKITLNKSGSVEIKESLDNVDISTEDGNIKIETLKNSTGHLSVLSCGDDGSIAVNKAYNWIQATTKYGNISITYADDCEKFDEETAISSPNLANIKRRVIAETQNGRIIIKGVENIEAKITNKGSAEIIMQNVVGSNNKVEGAKGRVYVEFNSTIKSAFHLSTETANGSSSVNCVVHATGGLNGKTNTDEKIYYGEGVSSMPQTTNTIKISTTDGDIKVRDTQTKNF